MRKLRIILADDHSMIRQGLKAVISSTDSWEICGEATDGKGLVELARTHTPDVAIIDITMPGMNGLEATRKVKLESPRTKVLIHTMHDSDSLADEALRAGACGYLLKSDAPELLLKALEAMKAGNLFLDGRIVENRHQKGQPSTKQDHSERYRSRLTPRERQIVQLLAEGKSNKQAAESLGISIGTVETHRKHIFGKLQLHCTADLVRYAVRNHLVTP